MTITMEDATTFGPFTLPTSRWRWREDFADATLYAVEDFFRDPDTGSIYRVLISHTSATPFDPDLLSGGDPVYELILDAAGLGGGALGGFSAVESYSSATLTVTAEQANTFFVLDTASDDIEVIIPEDSTAFDVPDGTVYGFTKLSDLNTVIMDHESASFYGADGLDTTVRQGGAVWFVRKIGADAWVMYGHTLDTHGNGSFVTTSGAGPVSVDWTTYRPGMMFRHSHSSGVTINLPTVSTQPKYNRGDELSWVQDGAGQLTFDVPGGTLQKKTGTTGRTVEQYSVVTLKFFAPSTWLLIGDYE
jgi:hypothetical protein